MDDAYINILFDALHTIYAISLFVVYRDGSAFTRLGNLSIPLIRSVVIIEEINESICIDNRNWCDVERLQYFSSPKVRMAIFYSYIIWITTTRIIVQWVTTLENIYMYEIEGNLLQTCN